MNDPELNEDIHQYPIRPNLKLDSCSQISEDNITVILPTIKPQTDEMNNMRFVINKLLDINLKVMIVEQSIDKYSYLFKFIECIMISRELTAKSLSHEVYVSNEKKYLKEELIEWAVQNKVKTKYVWVNDPNFYVDFSKTVEILKTFCDLDFVSACSSVINLSSEVSGRLISNGEHTLGGIVTPQKSYNSYIFKKSKLSNLSNLSMNSSLETLDQSGMYLYNRPKVELSPSIVYSNNVFKKDMAIIVCHFNWCKYINPSRNLNRFLRQMDKEEVPVYGVELSINDEFETTGRENWTQIKVGVKNICFQKEACINLVEKNIPKKYKKVAWIDPDLHFTNKNWYRETSEKLNTHKLVQMYSEGYGTDRYGRIQRRHPSIMSMYGIVPMDYWFRHPGHPGGAWGARRDLWNNGGLYPYCIMGGGDTVFVYTLFDYKFENDTYSSLGVCENKPFELYIEWKNSIKKYIKNPSEITYINNSFIHEWHGDAVNRKYNLRHNIIKTVDMRSNVCLNKAGIIELQGIKKKSIYDGILGYFKERDEDGLSGDMEEYLNFKNKLNENDL